MKVLQFGKFYPVRGGVEKVMELLRNHLPTRGIDCDLLCSSYDVAPYREVPHKDGGTTYVCKTLFRKFGTTFSPQLISKLREIQGHYDLIHIHHPDPMAGWVLKHSGYQGKVVLHWHSDVLVHPWLYKLYQPIEEWLLQRADKVVGTTPVYVNNSPQIAHGLQDRSKLTYMPIGISPQEPNRSLVEKIQAKYRGKRLLLTIGRLVPYKGMEYLVDMASHLGDEYLVLIAGQGPLKQELQQQIVAQGLEGKVKLLGFISDEEKVAYLEACHLFVLSSITKNEAFAIVQLEAMSHQKPVVSTEIADSGVSWVNRDRESGRTVPVKDGKALAEAVEEIFESEESYQGYARRAKARFESLFTIDAMIDRCVEIYKEIQKN